MKLNLVSIIIPVFNREILIKETLDSILAQSYSKWECIIVDDCSTDKTYEILLNYALMDSRFKIYKRPKKIKNGPSACRNYGLSLSKGSFVVFLDSDDILADFCLKVRIEMALKFYQFDLWIFKTKVFEGSTVNAHTIFNLSLPNYSDFNYLKLFYKGKYPFCISSPIWKTESLKKLNGFDEDLQVYEDPDLHIRAFMNKLKSKTFMDAEADNFYRIDNVKIIEKKKKAFLNKSHKSAFIYVKKHLLLNKNYILKFAISYFRDEILPNSKVYFISKFYFLYLLNGILRPIQIILIPFLIINRAFNLQHKKGFGFYRVNKLIFKK